jgi:diguanylate cyclase (GGDEF)-like protein
MTLSKHLSWLLCSAAMTVALLLTGTPVRAEHPHPGGARTSLTQYKIDVWQTEQGLPLNTVQSLFQTRDGYLWVGTAGGIARFDGVRFTTFDSIRAPEMASQPVFGFMEDAQGRLWVGHTKGAAVYSEGVFEVAISAEVTGGRRVWSFAQAQDGAVWAATENGLVRWDKGITKIYQQSHGLPTNRLRSLAFDTEGTLWIGTSGGGLVSFTGEQFKVYNPGNGFPHLEVRSVLADPKGGIWAATAGGGLAHVRHGNIQTYTVADGLPTDQLTTLARDPQGSLWIGTWGSGVSRFSDGRFTSISIAGGLAGEHIWSLQIDREGSVWVGTWVGGLNRLRNRPFMVQGTPEGLSGDNTRSVLHTRNGVTWVGTAGGGLSRIEGDRVKTLRKKDGLPSDDISSLVEDQDGSLWIGTYTAGVARLNTAGRLEVFGTAQGLPHAEVRALYQDSKGVVWAGTRAGLARFDAKAFRSMREEGAPAEGVTTLLEDRSGTLWIGTTGQGLYRLRDGKFSKLTTQDGLLSNWIMSLHEDTASSLWIGTSGMGLNRLRDGKLGSIRPTDGLWDGSALTILEDRNGHFWMTCNRGFYSVPRSELDSFVEGRLGKVNSTGYGPGDALRSTSFAGGLQPAGGVDAQGNVWLPSANGLVIVDPLHLPGSGQPPAVTIESVLVDGVDQPTTSSVVMPPGSVPLAIRYTAMTLLHADRVRFRYLVEGLSRDWVDAGRSREAAFPALPHGQYRLRVGASIDGQRWSELENGLPITVLPFVYQTAWFRALAALATVGAIALLFRLRTQGLRRRQLEMERLVAQRTEELRLANEHLSRLSFSDAVTGLSNRRRFDEALEQEWRRAARTQTPLAVVMADIDSFKQYNDTLGHPQGDQCLAAVADVFVQTVGRAGDLAARYGGEEFVVLIPNTDHAGAMAIAENLRAACEARAIAHPNSPAGPVVTISLGVASCIPSEDISPTFLVSEADTALYRAKLEGRNRVR